MSEDRTKDALLVFKRIALRAGARAGAALIDSAAGDAQKLVKQFDGMIGVGRDLLREMIPPTQDDEKPKPRPRRKVVAKVDNEVVEAEIIEDDG